MFRLIFLTFVCISIARAQQNDGSKSKINGSGNLLMRLNFQMTAREESLVAGMLV